MTYLESDMLPRPTMLFPRQFHEDALQLEPLDRLAFYDAILDFAFYGKLTKFEDSTLDVLFRFAIGRMTPSLEKFDERRREGLAKGGKERFRK
ncbi:MAG: hypothetical protein LUD72_12935 [Bacteroidales bacterium]|nr:hypothetical protein [Bacteroidales bacterium]